ncbi:TonB-dependent receptor domain-containing protein, partial [Salmonella enterica]|uniref:TonB-dependent receptor domain-containing protein n=1 Tax=Salmonella enterica TaxID=28901 RepID=UPI003FA6C501
IRTEQVEVGAKLDLDALTLAAALFDMQRPLERFDAGSGLNVQRGEQRHRGLELTANGRVTRALNVVAGLMLLDTETTGTGDASADGRRVLGVPRVNANLWAEYRLAGVHGLALNAGVY